MLCVVCESYGVQLRPAVDVLVPYCVRLVSRYMAPAMLQAGYQPAASPVHYTTSYKHSLVFLRMGEIIARNVLS